MQLLCVRRVSRTPCNLSFKRRHIHPCRSKMSISTASCWTACIWLRRRMFRVTIFQETQIPSVTIHRLFFQFYFVHPPAEQNCFYLKKTPHPLPVYFFNNLLNSQLRCRVSCSPLMLLHLIRPHHQRRPKLRSGASTWV